MAKEESTTWAAALGRLPSGLCILTARQGEFETAMLASWIQQCAFEPPMITVALRKGRPMLQWLELPQARLVVNIVPEEGRKLLSHFGRGFEPDQNAFEGIAVLRNLADAPVLQNAVSYIECEMVASFDASDHVVFLMKVLAGQVLNDWAPAVHTRKDAMRY